MYSSVQTFVSYLVWKVEQNFYEVKLSEVAPQSVSEDLNTVSLHILQNVLKFTEMYWNVLKCTELRNKSPLQLICGRKYESMYCVCWLLVCVLCAATGNIQECFVSHWIDLLQMHQSSGPTQSSVIFGPIKLCPFVSEYQTLNKRSLIF